MKNRFLSPFGRVLATLGLAALAIVPHGFGASKTWDGGGGDGNWSTGANWDLDTAPSATGDNLTFAGTTNVTTNNNQVTALATSGTAITFASGAGVFTLGGDAITLGSGGGAGQTIVLQQSTNNQVISANITLSGGDGDRSIVFGAGAGSLTLSGNINFSNDWLFPTTTAGTIVLSGSNTGDGKGTAAITAGTNTMRAMMRNNVAGTQLVLGSNNALGNAGSGSISAGTADFRGILAQQNMSISTQGGDRNLTDSTILINTANVTFNGVDDLTIGNVINSGGNRDFVVSNSGQVIVSKAIALSHDQTGRNLYVNLSGAGGMVVNGSVFDTFHSGGVTSGTSTLRKAGTGMLVLNGSSSYTGVTQIEGGILKIGNANALGATGTNSATIFTTSGTLDLNGFSIGETLKVNVNSALINSAAGAAALTADANLSGDLIINTTGDLSVARLIGTGAPRTVTKNGAGTLTTTGTSHNNLAAWVINSGTVRFANTSGFAADRGVTLNAGTLVLDGANNNLINDSEAFTTNGGTFDLNGKTETVALITGSSGAVIRNGNASAATLTVSGTTNATFAGTITDGTGSLNLVKDGTGTQTLEGINTYSGNTTVNGGTLILADNAGLEFTIGANGVNNSILGTGTVTLNGDFTFDLAGAGTTFGDSWTIVNVTTLTETFGSTFSVAGWTESANIWTTTNAGTDYEFREATGVLQVVPEPSTLALLGIGLAGTLCGLRRSRRRS